MSELRRSTRLQRLVSWAWPAVLHEHAVDNARSATTECSRRRVERDEVALYLRARATASQGTRHLA